MYVVIFSCRRALPLTFNNCGANLSYSVLIKTFSISNIWLFTVRMWPCCYFQRLKASVPLRLKKQQKKQHVKLNILWWTGLLQKSSCCFECRKIVMGYAKVKHLTIQCLQGKWIRMGPHFKWLHSISASACVLLIFGEFTPVGKDSFPSSVHR